MRKEQLEYFFQTYYSLVFRVAFMEVRSHCDAEDIRQEVFVRLLNYNPKFKSIEHEKAWMVRVTINLCRDFLKSKWNQSTVGLDSIPMEEFGHFKSPYTEHNDTILDLIELPERYRQPLYLFYYEDYSIKEIAGVLEIPENTVKTNLKRGREELKKMLSKER
ncbi:MAG: sigma-70 family RNA polymerase sigma factor [Lachnospiraceae bacterium]|nr:sigma-70 family RNA polymerase sigma factor [Lachnospiraceae bacterium]MDE5782466.1 sigma-70 family RNA polymerase sigma factor [Lachnospiraceae bacterium]MDE6252267.1 sigma-70 family RNA polymerase sigma factor [Lachnospiraceae bacterium]